MRLVVALVPVLVVAAGVAASGCTQPSADAVNEVTLGDGSSLELAEPENTATAGSISGVVVDEAIRPLAGVNVTLGAANRTASTDANGLFVFEALDPGFHILSIEATVVDSIRFLSVQTTADVVAGETAKVRIVLPADPMPVGRHSPTMKFDGFFEVGSGFVDEILDLYVYNETYGPVTLPDGPTCTCRFAYGVEPNLTTIVTEITWEETNPMPVFWSFDIQNELGDSELYFCEGNPCLYHVQGGNFTEGAVDFSTGVWSDPSWVYIQHHFQLFTTLFYVEPAPEGWSFVDGDV